jgi:hypothetical protein
MVCDDHGDYVRLDDVRSALDRADEQCAIWMRKRDRAHEERDAAIAEAINMLRRARYYVVEYKRRAGGGVGEGGAADMIADIDAAIAKMEQP